MKNRTLLLFFSLLFYISGYAQTWNKVENNSFRSIEEQRLVIPSKYESYELDFQDFQSILKNAPKRFESREKGIVINWPMPNGKMQKFLVKRSDVFHPDLAAKYPEIKAFTGRSLSDPSAILKVSMSHKGIEGMLLSSRHPTLFLDRYLPTSKGKYILYSRPDYHRELLEGEGTCVVEVQKDGYVGTESTERFGDCQLRKYRLALACTGEYAAFHGGNVPDVLAEFNAAMIRINGVYEKDLTITMELIADTDQLVFLSAGTDPYSNNNGGAMLGQNQATINQIIGFENYDIGHVFSTGGGGIAGLGVPCTNGKARGVTGLNNPTGDPFWIDFVAHEMGHQFGANHTQNNSCNRNNSTAMEPGSASTIMGYAGICSPNVQNNSDDYFHAVSQAEIANFVVAGSGGGCAEIITTDNNAPEIESITETGQVLPSRTPFYLTVEASDNDDDLLTYCWEQMNNGVAQMPPVSSSTVGPAFRSFDPSENPTRYFPRMISVLLGANGSTWEVLPNADRDMRFNVTVRDNNELGGCTDDEDLSVTFTTSAGPFLITSQNSFETWNSGDTKTVTWDVANTDVAPVSCENVDIILSTDRGQNFDIILAENVPNDGEQEITVPFEITTLGRIMLKCATKTFFDINNRDIQITAPFTVQVSPKDVSLCPGDEATILIDYTVYSEDPFPVTFELNGLPAGATYTFTPAQANKDTEVTLTIDNLTNDLAGSYELDIVTQADMLSLTESVNLKIGTDENLPIKYLSPAEGQVGVAISTHLSWEELIGVEGYEIEVSENPDFVDLVFSATTENNFILATGLGSFSVYYWRVRGVANCIDPAWQFNQSFQTREVTCFSQSQEANLTILSNAENTVESEMELSIDGSFDDIEISVHINHTWVGDLVATLRAPDGSEVILFDRPGVPESNFGCGENNIIASFSESAVNTYQDFENTCNDDVSANAIEGTFQPLESFSAFENLPLTGVWTLIIFDGYNEDGGEFINWSFKNCETNFLAPGVILKNNILSLNNTAEGVITNVLLEMENSDPANTLFTVRSTPMNGDLQKWNSDFTDFENLQIGNSFTQDDVNMGRMQYLLTDVSATDDSFIFDTEDDQLQYTSNNTFLISSSIVALTIDADITQISCYGETDGRIEVNGIGGLPGYTYSIDQGPFEAQNVFENLGTGDYIVTVRDDVGTEVSSETLTIIEPSEITYAFFPGNNEITIEGEGGTGELMYSLDGVNYTAEGSIEIFDGTTYRIYVKDENGCIAESFGEFIFYQIGGVEINVEDVKCQGDASGSITIVNVQGGLTPYSFTINNGPLSTENIFSDLHVGNYNISVFDSSGLSYDTIVQIQGPDLELMANVGIAEDFVSLSGSGGTPPFVYSLDGSTYQEDENYGPLANGDYVGYIQDSNGCIDSVMFTIMVSSTNNIELERLNLVPNPTVSSFSFESDRSIDIEYQIIDYTGRSVGKNSIASNALVSVEDLIPGLYFIKVNYKDATRVFKLSKI